ncbi:cupin domain-containing protein [Streptomyces sp. S1D4-11]
MRHLRRLHGRSGDWALRFPPPGMLKITAVVQGGMSVSVEGLPEFARLGPGDVAVFDGSRAFVVASDPSVEPVDATTLFADTSGSMIHYGGGEGAVFVGGHIELGRAGEELLLHALPPLLCVRSGAEEAPVMRWLLDQLLRELTARRAGADFAADQLAQLMFVQVLRAYLADADALPAGRLRALADERIAPRCGSCTPTRAAPGSWRSSPGRRPCPGPPSPSASGPWPGCRP